MRARVMTTKRKIIRARQWDGREIIKSSKAKRKKILLIILLMKKKIINKTNEEPKG